VFDAAMLVGLWQMDREDLLAGLLLFRLLYYLAPFVVSLVILAVRELLKGARVRRRGTDTSGGVPSASEVVVAEFDDRTIAAEKSRLKS
jgi:hypothetical protein